jgi:hypothetical protein
MAKYNLPIDYIVAVTELAIRKEDRRFMNDSIEHARLLVDLMIGDADSGEQVYVFSEQLKDEAYTNAIRVTQGVVHALVEKEPSDEMKTLLLERGFECKVLPEGAAGEIQHFLVAGNAFRVEIDHNKAQALANFNGVEMANFLKKRYQELNKKAA